MFFVSTTNTELERMLDSSLVFCTLLGPEGPGRHLRVSIGPLDLVVTDHNALFEELIRHTGYRPYFENYTVDASILDIDRKICITNDDF